MTRTSETYLTEEGTVVLRGRRSKMASTRTSTSTLTRRRRRLPRVGRGMSSPMTNFSTILRRTTRIRYEIKDFGWFTFGNPSKTTQRIFSVKGGGVVFEGFLILEIAIHHSNIQVWVDDVRRSYQLPGQVIHM